MLLFYIIQNYYVYKNKMCNNNSLFKILNFFSGGINRNWEGVPRQLFTPGEKRPRCVCVNHEKVDSSLLKEYEGCSSSSKECSVNN